MMKDLTERKLLYLDDAIDALNEYFARIGKLKRRGLTIEERAIKLDTIDAIKALPPAQPEREKGRWILTEDENYEYCTCSKCGYQNGENWMNGSDIPFCANCGADMRGAERREDG